jgi:predicted acyltransferase
MKRNDALDALRGIAILGMILSGSMAFGNILPAWMFHAQVPPPKHQFDPTIPGITWVDLVFPFFIFCMGAAMPLSLKKMIEASTGFLPVFWLALKRFLLLLFFAFFTQHMKAWVIAENPTAVHHLLSLLAFLILFVIFFRPAKGSWSVGYKIFQALVYAGALFLLFYLPFWGGKGFDFYRPDIILLVLANMAFFGTIFCFLTARTPLVRWLALPLLAALFLAVKEPGDSWIKAVFQLDGVGAVKIDWFYKLYYLKYFFILIPGMMAGEILLKFSTGRSVSADANFSFDTAANTVSQNVVDANAVDTNDAADSTPEHYFSPFRLQLIALIAFLLVITNLVGLYLRHLELNFLVSLFFVLTGRFLIARPPSSYRIAQPKGVPDAEFIFYRNLFSHGSYLLMLGLLVEPFEGGIKKDPSTFSYYFVTAGLAFFTLIFVQVLQQIPLWKKPIRFFALNGKNPMVAYVAGSLVVLPLLQLTGGKYWWDQMNTNAWMGFFKGVVFTTAVSMITIWFVKRKWFWKS